MIPINSVRPANFVLSIVLYSLAQVNPRVNQTDRNKVLLMLILEFTG